jgi:hypothetical protein
LAERFLSAGALRDRLEEPRRHLLATIEDRTVVQTSV